MTAVRPLDSTTLLPQDSQDSGHEFDQMPFMKDLLPPDHPFVMEVTKMFSQTGGTPNIKEMQMVATQLLQSMQNSMSRQLQKDSQKSHEKRKEEERRILRNE